MSRARSVFVCDDDQWVLDTVVDILSSLKLDILTFAKGKLALDQIAKESPDLIITDINMPEMTGLELLKFLDSNAFKIPVILLTGSLDPMNLREAVA
ncbi:MAG: response regulator [Bdellovibrionaceae bacterium]|nr:response regulator [Pseudobdellovibrionaceae bacterium]